MCELSDCCSCPITYLADAVTSLLLTVHSTSVRYLATFCITMGAFCTIGLVLAWCRYPSYVARHILGLLLTIRVVVAHNLGSETKKAAGSPLYMAIGQSGSILGSHLFPKTEGPRYM